MRRHWLCRAAALVTTAFLVAYGGGAPTPIARPAASAAAAQAAPSPSKGYTITQGYILGVNHLPDVLAPHYASQFNLEIKDVLFTNVPDTVTAMGRGDIDLMLNTPSTVISGLDRGLDLVMVAGGSYRSTSIILSSNLIVVEGDWGKLKAVVGAGASSGKKLKLGAAASLSANWVECYYSMKQRGIDAMTVLNVVNIPAFQEHPGALRRGDVDMLCTPEPYAALALASGAGKFFAYPFDTSAGETLGAIVVMRAALNNPEKKEALRRYILAFDHAVKKVNSDKELAVQTAMRIMKTNDRDLVTKALANIRFRTGFKSDEVKALAQMHFQLGQTNKDWSAEVARWTDDEFIRELK